MGHLEYYREPPAGGTQLTRHAHGELRLESPSASHRIFPTEPLLAAAESFLHRAIPRKRSFVERAILG